MTNSNLSDKMSLDIFLFSALVFYWQVNTHFKIQIAKPVGQLCTQIMPIKTSENKKRRQKERKRSLNYIVGYRPHEDDDIFYIIFWQRLHFGTCVPLFLCFFLVFFFVLFLFGFFLFNLRPCLFCLFVFLGFFLLFNLRPCLFVYLLLFFFFVFFAFCISFYLNSLFFNVNFETKIDVFNVI